MSSATGIAALYTWRSCRSLGCGATRSSFLLVSPPVATGAMAQGTLCLNITFHGYDCIAPPRGTSTEVFNYITKRAIPKRRKGGRFIASKPKMQPKPQRDHLRRGRGRLPRLQDRSSATAPAISPRSANPSVCGLGSPAPGRGRFFRRQSTSLPGGRNISR